MEIEITAAASLWLAVAVSGFYHGLNPGMGWPLAVSAGMMGRGWRDLLKALVPLTIGHLAAIMVVLLPFALLTGLVRWQWEIRVGAALLIIGVGIFLFFNRRHPRVLARIAPHRLALWSFGIATAHGAGLMLVPIYLGLCSIDELDRTHQALGSLMISSFPTAIAVSAFHALAMVAAGGAIALAVHAWLGLTFMAKSWFNLDAVWSISLIVIGLISLVLNGTSPHAI